ncbi:MAG: sigma-54 dependent transcriptional regulator [Thermodesulfobacteriota bacterium]
MTKNPERSKAAAAAWRPSVLVLDDEWATLEPMAQSLADGYRVQVASRPQEAMQAMARRNFDVLITDLRMPGTDGLTLISQLKERYPDTQYILMTAFSDIEVAVSAIRLGVADYLRKPFTMAEVRHALERCLERQNLRREVASLRAGQPLTLEGIIALDQSMKEVCRLAETVAGTDVTLLISGETGTGKGLLARAIHNQSPRRQKPFVEINCAAIPANLIESEMFGYERGAFTGAVARKIGRVEAASQGTLLLDEVGEMPLDMQAKMLHFLQGFTFERVGGTRQLSADVRVIAASNRDLGQAVKQGLFREDLFYRLHVIQLNLPALRERRQDILPLSDYFLERFAAKYNKPLDGFTPWAQGQMLSHPWPGNVREMENAIERAVILCQGSRVDRLELAPVPSSPAAPLPRQAAGPAPPRPSQSLADYLAQCEKLYLESQLSSYRGRVNQTARAAGVNPKTLYLKMTRHGLRKEEFRRSNRAKAGKQNSRGEGGSVS